MRQDNKPLNRCEQVKLFFAALLVFILSDDERTSTENYLDWY